MLACAEFRKQWGCVDASAARVILLRRGCGGLKHITIKPLWGQEAVREYSMGIHSVPGDEMPAHFLASPSSAEELRKHLTKPIAYRVGEAEV